MFLLGQNKISNDLGILDEKLEASLASELQEYKHLLHPIKLPIMQLVYSNTKISSVKIKENLELSWSDYYNAIPSLQKLDLVKIAEDFDDKGSKRQFLVITEQGKVEYVRLIKIINKFIERAKEIIPGFDSDILYPRS